VLIIFSQTYIQLVYSSSEPRSAPGDTIPAPQFHGESEEANKEPVDAGAKEYDDENHPSLLAVTHQRWQDKMLRKHGLYKNLPEIR
jgi:hypothetical protein